MTSNEYYILILFVGIALQIIVLLVMMFLLVRNDKKVSYIPGISLIIQFAELASEKKFKAQYSIVLILLAISIFIIPYSIIKQFPSENESNCNLKRHFLNSSYKELIVEKFIDRQNHATPSFRIMQEDSTSKVKMINHYWIEVYENAQIGDSLIKYSNSEIITLKRNGLDFNFPIKIDCK